MISVERFVIKSIVSSRKLEDNKVEYEVEWERTWESEELLREIAPSLFDNYLQTEQEQKENVSSEKNDDNSQQTLGDLFTSSLSQNTPNISNKRKGIGGINAVISRLQKTQKEELAKQDPLKDSPTTESTTTAGVSITVPHNEMSHPVGEDMELGGEYERVDDENSHFPGGRQRDNSVRGAYASKYPLSPPAAMEAKEGFLPTHSSMNSQYVPFSPPHTSTLNTDSSPRILSVTSGHPSSSPGSLQSLRSNVDNIAKLFTAENVYIENSSSHGVHILGQSIENSTSRGVHILTPPIHTVVLKCKICSDIFYEESKFKQHMFMHDQVNLLKQEPPRLMKPGTFQCKFCNLLFDDKDKLKLHYTEQHEKEFAYTQPFDQLYKCSLCDLTFIDYNKLLHHHQIHGGKREVFILPKKPVVSTDDSVSSTSPGKSSQLVAVKLEDDDNVFDDNQVKTSAAMTTLDFQPVNEALMSKTGVSNDVKKMYRCNLCDALFASEGDRANHSLVHVNRSSSLDCHICGKQFKHRTNLSTHLVVHSGIKPHQCHICLRRFTQKVNLQRHMHIHDGSRPFSCKFCAKSFTQRANLQRHVLSHAEHSRDELLKALDEIPNESEVNNAITESLTEAMNAIKDVSSNEKIEMKSYGKPLFHCDICDKNFAQKVNLQKHMSIHSGARPFQCYVCGKAFRQRASLQKHYTVHTNGSTSFICQTCNRLFVSRTNLQRHMLVHAMNGTQCYLCDQKFTTRDNLERHFSEHIEEATPNISLPLKYFEQSTPGQTFRCATCDIVFESPIIFSQHLQCHQKGYSPDTTPADIGDITKAYEENQACPLQCNACGLIFMSVAKLEAHMVTHAASNPPSGDSKHAIGVMINGDPASLSRIASSASESSSTIQLSSVKQDESSTTKSPTNRVSRCPVCKEMFPTKSEMREHYSNTHLEKAAVTSPVSVSSVVYQGENSHTPTTIATLPIMKRHLSESNEVVNGSMLTESEELLIKENEEFIKDNILGGSEEYESKGRYERGNYSCKICNRVLTYKYSLEKHMLLHTGSFPFRCHLCSKRFNHRATLDKHLVVHSGEKPYSCHICQRPFSQKSNLQRHQLTHTQNRDFICDVCGKRFNHMASLKTHSLIHTGAKPFSCYICAKRFNQKGNLKRHIQTHRSGKRNKVSAAPNHQSLIKNEEVRKYEEMNDFENMMGDDDDSYIEDSESPNHPRRSSRPHIKRGSSEFEFDDEADGPLPTMIFPSDVNSSQDDYDDSIPRKSNHSSITSFDMNDDEGILTVVPSDALEESVTMATTDRKSTASIDNNGSFHCDSCSKLFVSLASLEAHKKATHHIVCDVCGKRFSQKANLLKHKLIHANKKPFECRICQKAFRQKANLQRHELIHNKDRKTVNCSICLKAFRCTWSLKQHMKNHAMESGPFGCSICGESYKLKADLQKHLEVHAIVSTLTCRVCDEKFFTKENLLKHLQTHSDTTSVMMRDIEQGASDIMVIVNEDNIEPTMVNNDNMASHNSTTLLDDELEENSDGIRVVVNDNNEIQVQ